MKKTTYFLFVLIQFLAIPAISGDYVKFSWKMAPRFNESLRMYDPRLHEYDRKIMDFSKGWVVEFISSGKFDKMPRHEYVWEIEGMGELRHYRRTYTTTFPNLITSLPLGTSQPVKATVISSRNSNKSKRRSDGTGTPPLDEPISPDWLQVERLPKVGYYKIRLTVRSLTKNNVEPLVTTQAIELRNITIVCLGDSYASGEGNPDIEGLADWDDNSYCSAITFVQKAEGKNSDFVDLEINASWFEKAAHRSMKSGYALAARAIEDMDQHSVVTFINLAVSGAEIQNGLLQAQSDRSWMKKGQIGYLKDLIGNNKIDLLLLSIGGNDIGFSDILKEATTGEFGNLNNYLNRIESLKISYTALNGALRDIFAPGNILIGEYPTQLFSNSYSQQVFEPSGTNGDVPITSTNQFSCELFNEFTGYLTIHRSEIEMLNTIGEALQHARIESARQLGWIYAGGIADKFKNHGYCSTPDQTYWIQASYSCTHQGDTKGTMHPNQKGHAIIKNSVLEKIIPILLAKPETTGDEQTQ